MDDLTAWKRLLKGASREFSCRHPRASAMFRMVWHVYTNGSPSNVLKGPQPLRCHGLIAARPILLFLLRAPPPPFLLLSSKTSSPFRVLTRREQFSGCIDQKKYKPGTTHIVTPPPTLREYPPPQQLHTFRGRYQP